MFINGFDILWDEIDDYVADIKSLRSIDQFTFTKGNPQLDRVD